MTTYFPSRYHENAFHIGLAVTVLLFIMKLSCGSSFDFTTSARATNLPMGNPQSATVAIPKDTTKKKVFVPAVKIPVDSLGATIYYMRLIMQDFGIEMSGSKIREYQNIAEQQLQRLSKYLPIKDSIEIVNPKK